jgi:hypothetical protein
VSPGVSSPELNTSLIPFSIPHDYNQYRSKDPAAFLTNVTHWRDDLVGYQQYLTGYINYLNVTFKLESNELPKCPPRPKVPELTLVLPDDEITDDMTETEIQDVLFKHIESIQTQVDSYNRMVTALQQDPVDCTP